MILLRAVVRLVTVVLLLALALVGLAVALSCIGGSENTLSLAWLAEQLRLDAVRDGVSTFLSDLEGGSPRALSLLGGIAAVALGLLLLVGLLVPTRERLVTLATTDDGGRLTARRRTLAQIGTALVEQVRGVTSTKVRVRPNRRAGGRLTVRADRTRLTEPAAIEQASRDAVSELTDAFKLRARVHSRLGDSGARVQ